MPARSPFVTHIFVPSIDVLVAVARRPARDVARVAAGVGLRQREAAAELAGREARQPALLLLFGAVVHDQVRGDRVRVDDARQRHPAVRELLDDADVGEQVEPEPAVLLGDRDAEQAELLHLLDDRRRDTRRRARAPTRRACTSRAMKRRTVSISSSANLGIGRRRSCRAPAVMRATLPIAPDAGRRDGARRATAPVPYDRPMMNHQHDQGLPPRRRAPAAQARTAPCAASRRSGSRGRTAGSSSASSSP